MKVKNILTITSLCCMLAFWSCNNEKKAENTSEAQELVNESPEENLEADPKADEWMKTKFRISGTYANKQMTYYEDGKPRSIPVEFTGGTIPVKGEIVAKGYFKKDVDGMLYFEILDTADEVTLFSANFLEYSSNICPIFGWREGRFEDGEDEVMVASLVPLTEGQWVAATSAAYGTNVCGTEVYPIYYINSIE